MTAVAIVIIVLGLAVMIGQSLLLVMLWGQQQRAEVRAEYLGQIASMTAPDFSPTQDPSASILPDLVPTAPLIQPDVTEPDPDPAPASRTAVPSIGNPAELSFPPPARSAAVPPASSVQQSPGQPRESTMRAVPISMSGGPEARSGADQAKARSGLPEGSLLPDFELETLSGESFRRSQHARKKTAMLFLNLDCPGSKVAVDALRSVANRNRSLPDLLYVVDGGASRDTVRAWLGKIPRRATVLLQEETELATVLRAGVTPAAYILDSGFLTEGPLRTGARAVLEAIGVPAAQLPSSAKRSTEVTRHPLVTQRTFRGLAVGTPAPKVEAPLLGDEGVWRLSAGANRPALLIFWDPDCPPCDAMLDTLVQEAESWTGFDSVVITRGGLSENTALIARSLPLPIAVQNVREIARQFQVLETPAAVVIDREGVVTRPPAIGASAIFQAARDLRSRAGSAS